MSDITIAQFLYLPVDLIGTVAAEHKAGAAQHMNLVVGALSVDEGVGVVLPALTALILDLTPDNVLVMQSNLTYQSLYALLALGLGMGTLNWSQAETDNLNL
jgi:hypothetical protein